jgi:hypothetical protein
MPSAGVVAVVGAGDAGELSREHAAVMQARTRTIKVDERIWTSGRNAEYNERVSPALGLSPGLEVNGFMA